MPTPSSPRAATWAPNALVPGTPYRIIRPLGAGGIGRVYEVEHTTLRERYALKVLNRQLIGHEDPSRRLDLEASLLRRLRHANLVDVHHAGVSEGRGFYVMELLSGHTLRDEVRRGPLEPARACAVVRQLLAGLGAAHAVGLVHRDVKPENIFITRRGIVKLLDFGVAKVLYALPQIGAMRTDPDTLVGTPLYMAPEYVDGQTPSPLCDVYSAGVVLWEALTGRHPFPHSNELELLRTIAYAGVPPLERAGLGHLVAPLRNAVRRATALQPAKRYPSASTFAEALAEALDAHEAHLRASLPSARPPMPSAPSAVRSPMPSAPAAHPSMPSAPPSARAQQPSAPSSMRAPFSSSPSAPPARPSHISSPYHGAYPSTPPPSGVTSSPRPPHAVSPSSRPPGASHSSRPPPAGPLSSRTPPFATAQGPRPPFASTPHAGRGSNPSMRAAPGSNSRLRAAPGASPPPPAARAPSSPHFHGQSGRGPTNTERLIEPFHPKHEPFEAQAPFGYGRSDLPQNAREGSEQGQLSDFMRHAPTNHDRGAMSPFSTTGAPEPFVTPGPPARPAPRHWLLAVSVGVLLACLLILLSLLVQTPAPTGGKSAATLSPLPKAPGSSIAVSATAPTAPPPR